MNDNYPPTQRYPRCAGGVFQDSAQHLKHGGRVRMRSLGLAKLEIESDKVPDASDFTACKHIRGVRLHLIPESEKGSQPLYEDIKYEKIKG